MRYLKLLIDITEHRPTGWALKFIYHNDKRYGYNYLNGDDESDVDCCEFRNNGLYDNDPNCDD